MLHLTHLLCLLSASLTCATPLAPKQTAVAKRYLSTEKLVVVGAASASILVTGELICHVDSTRRSLLPHPLLGEDKIQRELAGEWHAGKSNFLDNTFGYVITPAGAAALLFVADVSWPECTAAKDAAQDIALFLSGLATTTGLTNLAKGTAARKRPFVEKEQASATAVRHSSGSDDYKSFFSGHASTSFFSVTYLNKRVRAIMRQRLAPEEYRVWRWVSPALLFGWSTFVGWSRVDAYKHYPSDVALGAAVGWLVGEFFFRLGDVERLSVGSDLSNAKYLRVAFWF